MRKLKQILSGIALVAGGLLTFNADANAQESKDSQPRTSRGDNFDNLSPGAKLKQILKEKGCSALEFETKSGRTFVVEVFDNNLEAYLKDNPFQFYSDRGMDGTLDHGPYYHGRTSVTGENMTMARRTFSHILNTAITSGKKSSVKKISRKDIIEREGKIYELAKKTGEDRFYAELNVGKDIRNEPGIIRITVNVGDPDWQLDNKIIKEDYEFCVERGMDLPKPKYRKRLPKRIEVRNNYFIDYDGSRIHTFQRFSEEDTNGDGVLEKGNPVRYVQCLDAVLKKYDEKSEEKKNN